MRAHRRPLTTPTRAFHRYIHPQHDGDAVVAAIAKYAAQAAGAKDGSAAGGETVGDHDERGGDGAPHDFVVRWKGKNGTGAVTVRASSGAEAREAFDGMSLNDVISRSLGETREELVAVSVGR